MKHWTEEMADRVGQIVDRLEKNFDFLKRTHGREDGLIQMEAAKQEITRDLEALKDLKMQLESAES